MLVFIAHFVHIFHAAVVNMHMKRAREPNAGMNKILRIIILIMLNFLVHVSAFVYWRSFYQIWNNLCELLQFLYNQNSIL
jgi:hypothetical protein